MISALAWSRLAGSSKPHEYVWQEAGFGLLLPSDLPEAGAPFASELGVPFGPVEGGT